MLGWGLALEPSLGCLQTVEGWVPGKEKGRLAAPPPPGMRSHLVAQGFQAEPPQARSAHLRALGLGAGTDFLLSYPARFSSL